MQQYSLTVGKSDISKLYHRSSVKGIGVIERDAMGLSFVEVGPLLSEEKGFWQMPWIPGYTRGGGYRERQ